MNWDLTGVSNTEMSTRKRRNKPWNPWRDPPRLRLGDSAGPAGCDPPGKRMDSAPGNLTEHGERDDRGCARVFSLDRSGAHAPNLRGRSDCERSSVCCWSSECSQNYEGGAAGCRPGRLPAPTASKGPAVQSAVPDFLLKLLTSDTMLTDSHVDYISYRILFDIVSFRCLTDQHEYPTKRACNTC